MTIGFRVLPRARAVDAGTAARFRDVPTANVSDSISRMSAAGDVLVVDGGGDLTNSLIGELMLSHARAAGAAGVVINGAVRDFAWIRSNDFPVFAAGVTHRGPYKDGPGEINVPIALDGMVIEPGDLVLGDDDGLLCVPFAEVEAVHAAAKA